jgi:hypothetical protein
MFLRYLSSTLFFLIAFPLWAETQAPVTIGGEPSDQEKPITLSGTLTKDWALKLDHPIRLYSLTAKKTFQTSEVELLSDDCSNCDKNWVGSHVEALGTLDEDSHDPLQAILWIDRLEGKPQPLSGPLYHPGSDRARLTGTLSLVPWEGVTLVRMDLDGPINVARGGEFVGPIYGLKALKLLYLDKRQGLRPGPVTVEGYMDYYANDLEDMDAITIRGHEDPGLAMGLEVTKIEGALDEKGGPVGLREILVRSEWKGSRQYQEDREAEMERSLDRLQYLTNKNRIAIVYDENLEVAYRFVDGHRTKEIKAIQPKADLKVLVKRFYGLQ